MKKADKTISSYLKNQLIKTFTQTICDFTDSKETSLFFNDFLTANELETLSKRLAIAYWLKKRRSYENIKNNLKVSSATIAKVSSTMKKEGFNLAIKKIEAEEWANIWVEKIKKFTKKLS